MFWWFAETTLAAAILACAAALIGRLPRVGPSARHVLWLVVLIKFVTPPVVKSPWSVPLPTEHWPSLIQRDRPEQDAHGEDPLPDPKLETFSLPVGASREFSTTSEPDVSAAEIQAPVPRVFENRPRPSASIPALGPRLDGDAAETIWSCLFGLWIFGLAGLGTLRLSRIVRFQRRVRRAASAPAWLIDEAENMAARIGVKVPGVLVVPHLTTPMLWCLSRPILLLPDRLVESLQAAQWRGILAHELAHLARGDQWVSRLELIAGLIWWWNPLYLLARRRIDAEAELACDAWVVWALPDDRLTYAEVLFQVCSESSRAITAAPVLGAAGSGRFFERRLTMILRDKVPCRISPWTFVAASVLALLALPSWTQIHATPLLVSDPGVADISPSTGASTSPASASISDSAATVLPISDDDDRDSDDAVDDIDNDDDDHHEHADKEKSEKHDRKRARGDGHDVDVDVEVSLKDIDEKIESTFGPDFEKKVEAWAEKLAKEMQAKFGENSEFVKKMEAMGKEMEKKFGPGSEFEKKMEAMGKEMEKKFGPGSEFEKQVKEKLGPGSEFEKKMKSLGEELEKKFGPGSEFEVKLRRKHDSDLTKAKAKAKNKDKERPSQPKGEKMEKTKGRELKRAERVKALEAQINALQKQLKALQRAESDDLDEDQD